MIRTEDGIVVGDPIIFNLPVGKNFDDTDLKLGRGGKPTVSVVTREVGSLVRQQAETIYARLACSGPAKFDFISTGMSRPTLRSTPFPVSIPVVIWISHSRRTYVSKISYR